MTEEQMQRLLMQASAAICVLAGLAAVGSVVYAVVTFAWSIILGSLLLIGLSIGAGIAASHFGREVDPVVFNNAAEKEVLTRKQRQELRHARGEVVMERALIEVQHEHENIVHRLAIEAGDPNIPPHQTQWSPTTDWTKQIPKPVKRDKPVECDHGFRKGDCPTLGCEHY